MDTSPLCSPAAKASPDNRRAVVRYAPTRPLSCHLSTVVREGQWPAAVRDLSTDGVGLVVAQPFERGTIVGTHLANALGTYTRFLLLQIMHCIQEADTVFFLGGEFIGRLSPEELGNFLGYGVQAITDSVHPPVPEASAGQLPPSETIPAR